LVEKLETAPRTAFGQNARDFIANTLPGDISYRRREPLDCGERRWLDRDIEPRGKSHRANHAQSILFVSLIRIANSAKPVPLKIFTPAHQVDNVISNRIINHAVDRKITAPDIFFQSSVAYMARPPPVQVRPIMAKARDLKRLAANEDKNDAKLRTHRNGFRKETLDIFGVSAGRDIEILRRFIEQHIAHAAAGKISFIAFLPKMLNNGNGSFTSRHRRFH